MLRGKTPQSNADYDEVLRAHKVKNVFSMPPRDEDGEIDFEDDMDEYWDDMEKPVIKIHGCVSNPSSMVWTR